MSHGEAAPIRILHVDDDPDLLDLAAAYLGREDDLAVETATGAGAGLDRLDDDVDCVVSDYRMPGMDGIEFLEAVREEYPDLPFVLYTGQGSEEVASDAIAAGVTSYLRKDAGTEQYALLANRIRNHVSRYRAERRAAQQTRISEVVREINRRLVVADSREAIEQGVCEVLAGSEPYLFAWIGREDPDTGEVIPSAQAGMPFDLDRLTVTAGEGPHGQGPVGTAIRTGEIQVVGDTGDLGLPEWRSFADEHGIASLAVVPLVHRGTTYGILDVYAGRPHAFDRTEREVLSELGDTIGHAIDTVETIEALRE